FKLELPASQLEIMLPPLSGADAAAAALADARAALVARAAPLARPAALALHPFAATEGRLNTGERHKRIERRYGALARRQLLCALQVHVAVRGAERALAVHDALRGHLPALTALTAAAPFHGGRDTGHASWRPQVADLLPRHGIPPAPRRRVPAWPPSSPTPTRASAHPLASASPRCSTRSHPSPRASAAGAGSSAPGRSSRRAGSRRTTARSPPPAACARS